MKKRYIILIIILVLIIGMVLVYLPQRIPVLGYHGFYKTEVETKGAYVANINDFEEQMKYLNDHHYKTLSMDDYYCWKEKKCKMPRKSVVITFDDGYKNNYLYAFDILKKYEFKATVFVIGGYLNSENYLSIEDINQIQKDYPNIEFASHTYNMHDYDLEGKTKEIIENDISDMKNVIDTPYIAYPFGLHNDLMKKIYKENGYKLAFGFGPDSKDFRKSKRNDDNYNIPRLCIDGNMSINKFKLRLLLPF